MPLTDAKHRHWRQAPTAPVLKDVLRRVGPERVGHHDPTVRQRHGRGRAHIRGVTTDDHGAGGLEPGLSLSMGDLVSDRPAGPTGGQRSRVQEDALRPAGHRLRPGL